MYPVALRDEHILPSPLASSIMNRNSLGLRLHFQLNIFRAFVTDQLHAA
jgi:hypothetical protein